MKGKSLKATVTTTLAAITLGSALACASVSSAPAPTSVPATPYTCGTGQNSNIAFLSPSQANAQPVRFDLATLVDHGFPTTYEEKLNTPSGLKVETKGNPNRTTFACTKVVTVDNYVLVFGEDKSPSIDEARVFGSVPRNIIYIFKKLPSSQSGLGFVGAAPDFGEQKEFSIVKNYGTFGDLLIVGSDVMYTENGSVYYPENNIMLDAVARALGFERYKDEGKTRMVAKIGGVEISADDSGTIAEKARQLYGGLNLNTQVTIETISGGENTQFGAKLLVYRLGEQVNPYNSSAPPAAILEKIAARPFLLERDAEIKSVGVVQKDGEPHLELVASAWSGQGRRHDTATMSLAGLIKSSQSSPPEIRKTYEGQNVEFTVGPYQVPLRSVIEKGIAPTEPLLRR